jgi:GTP-binding protein
MFTDQIQLQLQAGRGGNGVVAWTREKYIPKGGPCGGNGGRGGDIVIRCSTHFHALDRYRNIKLIRADNGLPGGASSRIGKSGKNNVIEVPAGTILKDVDTGEILYDFTEPKQEILICQGGKGGKGNECFKTSTNQAPNKSTPGLPGEERTIELELKLIADVGFVGMPNAGKSTLLSSLTMQKVKIGDYPFTTLVPNLGYIEFQDFSRVHIADIPGLIEGAHRNRGLGFAFLKHIERCKVLVYLLDAAREDISAVDAYKILHNELASYNEELVKKPSLVVLNKSDLEESAEGRESFLKENLVSQESLFMISAKERNGLEPFISAMKEKAQLSGKRYI